MKIANDIGDKLKENKNEKTTDNSYEYRGKLAFIRHDKKFNCERITLVDHSNYNFYKR
jgi:hypothetical protein